MSDEPLSPIAVEGADYGKSTLFRFSMMTESAVRSDTPLLPFRVLSPRQGFTYTGNDTLHALKDIKALNEGLYYFGEWLASEDFDPDFSEIAIRISGVNALDQTRLDKLWNSLYKKYDTLRQDSVAKTLINMIRAHEFVSIFNELTAINPELTDIEEIDLIRIRKTPIKVIQAVLTGVIPITPLPPGPRPVRPVQKKKFKQKQEAAVAQHKEKELKRTLTLFNGARSEYAGHFNKEYADALDAFGKSLIPSSEPQLRVALENEPPEEGELPVFNFEFPPFDMDYIQTTECYGSLVGTIEDYTDNHDFCGNLENLESYLEKNIQAAQEQFRNNYVLDVPKMVMFNDHEIVFDDNPQDGSIVVRLVKLLPNHNKLSIIFTHFSGSDNAEITEITGVLSPVTGEPVSFSDSKIIDQTNEYTTFVLAENTVEPTEEEWELTCTVWEEDESEGKEYNITIKKDFYCFGIPSEYEAPIPTLMRTTLTGEGSQMHGIKKIGIKDYLRVEQEVCCYVPGEVSHIENVMAREYRKKLVRDLERHEVTTEESEESERENTTDTTSTDRYELHKEVSQMLTKEQSRQINLSAGMNASYSFPLGVNMNVTAGTNLSFSNSSSQADNYNQAESIAREVVQKATERVVHKMSYKRTARMLREHEETNEHGFDNRNGDTHFVGIYRWVDKIYKNTVFNYGKRLQYDFMLPEPARNFKYWMTSNSSEEERGKKPKPVHPRIYVNDIKETSIFNWKHISEHNYAVMAAEYGADVEPMPQRELRIAKSFSENPKDKFPISWDEPRGSFQYEIEIPEGYSCNNYRGGFNHVIGHKGTGHQFSSARIIIESSHFYYLRQFSQLAADIFVTGDNNNKLGPQFESSNRALYVTKALPVGVSTFNIGGFSLNVVADCVLTEEAKTHWQQRTYLAIMDGYRKKMQEWIDANPEEAEKKEVEIDYRTNPGKNRAIEAKELKRLCIEMMTAHLSDKRFPDSYHRDGYTTETDSHTLNLNEDLDKHAALVGFLEHAFEWELMAYQFYPYMYADKKSWKSLIKEHKSSSDPLFEAFLQSGMAKLTLTIAPGFERRVMFFLDKGIIPVSNDFIPEGGDDWYCSVDEQLRVDEKKAVGDSWETRVPTDLLILQADAAPLQQTGLPCVCPQSDNDGIAIGQSALNGNTINNAFLISNIKDALIEVIGHLAPLINCGGGSSSGGGSGTAGNGFLFPKHADLTTDDIGKLVVNAGDGKASVAVISPELPPQTGKYKIRIEEISDLEDESKVRLSDNLNEISVSISRLDWRNGDIPATVEDELTLLKEYIENLPDFDYLSLTIEENALIVEEEEINYTRIELVKFYDPIYVVRPSLPETPAAFTGYPLGKLIGISGSNAVISNGMIDTYVLGSPFTVNQDFFVSDGDLDLENVNELLELLNHIMVPAAEGKVRPINLTFEELDDYFIDAYRNHFVGIGIASSGTEVTVVKLPYLSLFFHGFRRVLSKGLLSGEE